MKRLDGIRKGLLSLCFVLLILTQSLVAVSRPSLFSFQDTSSKKAEVQQNLLPKAHHVGICFRLTPSAFLFYWLGSRHFDQSRTVYNDFLSGYAGLVNPFSANCYYTHLSALAP
uniref:Uncharacterized protein n=1 Tax=Roseihalotalea indica TaxID=2867963 RepID=A0AA49GLG1_9BACT|nr:hypothetical protein K4G66_24660 [Tunicatimonas sp. TK19036]